MDLPEVLRTGFLVTEAEPLGPRTTFGIGGTTPFLIEPRDRRELIVVVAALQAAKLPFRLLGQGSNLLISDAGVDEVVIHTHLLRGIYHHGEVEYALRADAGASLARLVSLCQRQGLSGTEGLVGIPGTVGGAVHGNAGGSMGWIGERVVSATIVDADGQAQEIALGPGDFGYRTSVFKGGEGLDAKHRGATLVDVVLQLTPEAPAVVEARVAEVLQAKRSSQPLAARSAGCMFRNTEDSPSSRLIDAAGCKGLSVGGARVSERHANFFLNAGGATAADVSALVELVRRRVRAAGGDELSLEVELWGPVAAAQEG